MSDPLAALLTVLSKDETISGYVAKRIWADEVPPEDAHLLPDYAIVLQLEGGSGNTDYSGFRSVSIGLVTFGKTTEEAQKLHTVCQRFLQRMRRKAENNTVIYSASLVGDQAVSIDRLTNWPFVRTTWAVATNLEEIT